MEIIRNLFRRKLRNFLTISGIVIGVLALTTMGAMAEKTNLLLDGGEKFFSDHIEVGDTGNSFGAGLIRVDKTSEILRVDGVAAAFPTIGLPAKPGDTSISFGPGDIITAAAAGVERYEKFKLKVAHGRREAARGEVVLGSDLANEFHSHVGDSLRLPVRPKQPQPDFVDHPFTVVGILDKTLTAPDSFAYVTFEDGQMLLQEALPPAIRGAVDASQLATGIAVYARPGIDLDQLARRISREVPGVRALPPSELVGAFRAASVFFTAITLGSAILALVIGGLAVVNTMVMAVTERVREIGLKKAVGAQTTDILREFLLEATLIGIIGGLIGLVLGLVLTAAIDALLAAQNLSLFVVSPRLVGFALLFSVGLGALAGVIPALRAARLDPVRALRSQ